MRRLAFGRCLGPSIPRLPVLLLALWGGVGIWALSAAFAARPAAAGGGGFCEGPIKTDRGTTVTMKSLCFRPTVVRVRLGETVTWVNREDVTHQVIGTNGLWGTFESDLNKNQLVTYRFRKRGIYPYTCSYHFGMTGAVVVGNFKGAGAASVAPLGGSVVSLSDAVPSPTAQLNADSGQERAAAPVVRSRLVAGWRVATFVGFGLFVIAAGALVMQYRAIRKRASVEKST